ncbi:MAG: 1-acyl-sn-glycerol-3-phosphate acyltransferase [Lachnospiraceae bacterium]|nr:1-acyl-sn-glycerol-3-phosphate acyltransferase [Lachnospiraceae bacterium]
MRIKVHVSGLEKLPKGTRFLLVQNHRSKFDPILTWYVLRKYDLAFLSKEENMHIPIFGRIIRKCCFMSIDRKHPGRAMETVNTAVELLKDDQVSIGVYPEGTRNTTQEPLLPFHNSMFKIAQNADVPIVVMACHGTSAVKDNFPKKKSHVYFEVTGVLKPEDIKGLKTNVIGNEVARQILDSPIFRKSL